MYSTRAALIDWAKYQRRTVRASSLVQHSRAREEREAGAAPRLHRTASLPTLKSTLKSTLLSTVFLAVPFC